MEVASAGWISDMVMDRDPFLNSLSYTLDDHDLDFYFFHSESFSSIPHLQPSNNFHIPPEIPASSSYDERPAKQLKRDVSTPPRKTSPSFSSSPQMISFGKTSSSSSSSSSDYYASVMPKNEEMTANDFSYLVSQEEENNYGIAPNHPQLIDAQGASLNKSKTRTQIHAKEHVVAERKRRERLNQLIVALSANIPGLKKMDKASILGDAIKYLKQLQERVKILEEEVSKKAVESVVLVKKSQLPADDDATSSDHKSCNQSNQQNLPEIEARISGKFVLIRVHCQKHKGSVPKILDEIEKLNKLTILNSSVLPFGSSMLDITIIAQMNLEFNVILEDFVKNLQRALQSMK